MGSPFPGMDPFLEKNPLFHELHTQMLASAQRLLQPQVRPKYVARLERHLSEGSVWGMEIGSLRGKAPDVTVVENNSRAVSPRQLAAETAHPLWCSASHNDLARQLARQHYVHASAKWKPNDC